MLHVIETAKDFRADFGAVVASSTVPAEFDDFYASNEVYGGADIDIVDDSLLNTAPHNAIERQLLTGDMVGLALMSGAILWSAMGAFG